jgi:hypothetical protein
MRVRLRLKPSKKASMRKEELTPYKGGVDKNGFYTNANGQQVFLMDKDGRCFLQFNDRTLIKFSPNDSNEASKAGDQIAEQLAKDFDKQIRQSLVITLSEEGKEKLAKRGYRVGGVKGAEVHQITIHFDKITSFLDYIGNAGGFKFKECVYLRFKEKIKNSFLGIKSGLYGGDVPKKRIEFVNEWIKFTDKLIAQERERNKVKVADYSKGKSNDTITHRVTALAHLLKVECNEAEPIPRKEQKPKKFEQAFDSLNSKTKSITNPYREPTKDELTKVISLLEGSPKSQQKAKERLQELIKSKD